MFYVLVGLLVLLFGCGGAEFEAAPTRVVAEATVDQGGLQEASPPEDAQQPEAGDAGPPEANVGEAGADAQVDAVQEAGADAPDPKVACGCYRNVSMDPHCAWPRVEAWVCGKCTPAGCTNDYQPQPSLACCEGDGGR